MAHLWSTPHINKLWVYQLLLCTPQAQVWVGHQTPYLTVVMNILKLSKWFQGSLSRQAGGFKGYSFCKSNFLPMLILSPHSGLICSYFICNSACTDLSHSRFGLLISILFESKLKLKQEGSHSNLLFHIHKMEHEILLAILLLKPHWRYSSLSTIWRTASDLQNLFLLLF